MTDKLDARIDRLFVEEMLPLAAKAKASGARFLEVDWEPDARTYYVDRPQKTMSKAAFEFGGCASTSTVEADLRSLWRDDPELGLEGLATGMSALAKELREVGQETGDVSNFIYVMY